LHTHRHSLSLNEILGDEDDVEEREEEGKEKEDEV
jgi:hypothetical protein